MCQEKKRVKVQSVGATRNDDLVIFVGYAEPVDLLSIVARGTVVLWVGYSYEDVIGPVDSFRVTHLTCDMIQKRRVVVTSSIGSSVRAISIPRSTRIASSPSSSLVSIALCLPLQSSPNNCPLSFCNILEQSSRDTHIRLHTYVLSLFY